MVAKPKGPRPGGRSGEHPWAADPSLSSRPPFEPENEMALRHGALSPRKLAPIAAELEQGILEEAPWCGRPAFRAAVTAWAWAEASCVLYRQHFAEKGLADESGEPLSGLVRWDRSESRAAMLRSKLALDPNALGSLLDKLASAGSAGGEYARAEIAALQREVKQLDAEISAANERKALGT